MGKNRKLLVLGGTTNMIDLVKTSQRMGIYTIVTDWYDTIKSPAKLVADEYWNISITEYETLAGKIADNGITGIIASITDSYLQPYAHLCELCKLPCYATKEVLALSTNKVMFKKMCIANDVPVARKYDIDVRDDNQVAALPYPVIVKPSDGSGSRGFNICQDKEELARNYENALRYSPGKDVIIEDYIPYDAAIIHYTMIDGKCYYSGMSDKISRKFKSTGASVMAFQQFPSNGERAYLASLDEKVRHMFEQAEFRDGPIWIEAFYDGGKKFVFNEMAHRFGGSLTYHPVQYFYGISQIEMLINSAFGIKNATLPRLREKQLNYCIIPIHCKPGTIIKIEGTEAIQRRNDVYAYCPTKSIGQQINEWGSAQQVFCYLHVLFKNANKLKESIQSILLQLKVIDEKGNNMLYTLFDLNGIN